MFSGFNCGKSASLKLNNLAPFDILIPFATARATLIVEKLPGPLFIKIVKLNTSIGSGEVLNTNNCQISICNTRYKNKVVIFCAIDNLVKGASGQAIQNMNLMYNFKENLGLK